MRDNGGMASFTFDGTEIHFDEYGSGFPVLLIAPGGMKSAAPFWESTPWNPIPQLSETFRVIAMDQRNAGRSSGPISADDSWDTYTRDQLALLDYLGIEKFHAVGMCIGLLNASQLECYFKQLASAITVRRFMTCSTRGRHHYQPLALKSLRRSGHGFEATCTTPTTYCSTSMKPS